MKLAARYAGGGETLAELAREAGCSAATVHRAVRRHCSAQELARARGVRAAKSKLGIARPEGFREAVRERNARKRVALVCRSCGAEFRVPPSRSGALFCSMRCRGRSRAGTGGREPANHV
jgi:transposase-like protein